MGYETFEKLCKERGVKPGRVSRETGVATSTLTCWKKGEYTPKADKIKKIADYFNVPVDYLLTGEISALVETETPARNERAMMFLESFEKATPEVQQAVLTLLKASQ